MNAKFFAGAVVSALVLMAAPAGAATVDLNDWTAESYGKLSAHPNPVWNVSNGGATVTQTQNAQPTFFVSDFNAYGTKITGTVTATNADDDFFGFVLGYNSGDVTNSAADFLLIDWKRSTQNHNFAEPANTPGGNANRGLAVSQVSGTPNADEFWQHTDFTNATGGGVEELARGLTLGSAGWTPGKAYKFTFDFGPNNLQVFVDDVKQIDITGSFSNGSFGFYNFSQPNTKYSGFTVEEGTFTAPIPEPSTWAMMIGGFGMMGGAMRRRSKVQFAV